MFQWKGLSLLFSSTNQQLALIILWITICNASSLIYCVKATTPKNPWMHCPPKRKPFISFVTNSCSIILSIRELHWMKSQRWTSSRLGSGTTDSSSSVNGYDTVNMVDYCSLECLQRRVRFFVQDFQQQPLSPKISMVIAGGGGHLLSTLASTPGASSILLEGTTPYSRKAFQDFIQREMPLEIAQPFKYCSAEAVMALADAACRRAIFLSTSELDGSSTNRNWTNVLRGAIGVASTSVLQSSSVTGHNADGSPILRSRRSIESGGSRAFCAVKTSTGLQVQLFAQLNSAYSDACSSQAISRSRFDEDIFVSHCLLTCIRLSQVNSFESAINVLGLDANVEYSKRNDNDRILFQWKSSQGDDFTVTIPSSLFTVKSLHVDLTLQNAAKRILEKNDDVVTILLPNSFNSTVEVLHATRLPPHSLVVPGSFNPPHVGHILLALASAKAMNQECNSIWFELSISNADKPALTVETIVDRIKYFFEFREKMPTDLCWGILLTNAPLFKQKVDLLAPLQINAATSILHFSIGTDTLVRLIDPKYYNNSEDQMFNALIQMSCHFIVGGRLDQRRISESIFISGEQVIEGLPIELQNKFTILPNFRFDLSSTEIRKQAVNEIKVQKK